MEKKWAAASMLTEAADEIMGTVKPTAAVRALKNRCAIKSYSTAQLYVCYTSAREK